MKIKLASTIVLTSLGMSLLGSVAQAATYPSATEGMSEVSASVILGDDGGPIIPPIDPEIPNPPVDPENPNTGPLSLRYVSDVIFGEIEISTESKTVYAKQDTGVGGERFDNIVTVQDFRNDNERDGWELTVMMDNEFIPGSKMKMTPFIHEATAQSLGLETPNKDLILNTSEQVFARTVSTSNPAGIVSMGLANPETEGVELLIPANTPTGDYATTITWNLVAGPLAPESE